MVLLGGRAQPAGRGARRRRAEVDLGAGPVRRARGVRGRRRGDRTDLRRRAAGQRPARARPRHDHHRRRRGPRPAEDAEPDLPARRHPGRDPVDRPAAGAGQRGGVRRRSASRPSGWRRCRRRASSDGPELPVRAGAQRQAARPGVHRRRGRADARPRGRGAAAAQGGRAPDGRRRAGSLRPRRPGRGCGSTPRAPTCARPTSTPSPSTPTASASRRPSRPTTWRGSPRGLRASRSSARSRARGACWPPGDRRGAGGPPSRHGRGGPAARPEHHRRQRPDRSTCAATS